MRSDGCEDGYGGAGAGREVDPPHQVGLGICVPDPPTQDDYAYKC